MRLNKEYILHASGGKRNLKEILPSIRVGGVKAKIIPLKRPIGLRTHGLYYRPIDLRQRR